jgi:acetyltransferase-like isoleucine patch superfamily enzyme
MRENMKIPTHQNEFVDKDSFINPSAIIGKDVKIEKNVYVSNGVRMYGNIILKEGTYIGENCIIGHPQRAQLSAIVKSKDNIENSEGPQTILGRNCTIRAGTIIYSEVTMGDDCQTGHNVLIREKTVIGSNTLIGTNSIIDGNVTIGNHVSIQTGVYIPLFCTIGNYVFMGPFSKLTNDKYMMRKKYELNGVIIEDYVSLGANSVILPGIRLKRGTMVGAGSVVTKDTSEKDIVIGNPARVLKRVPEDWKI